METSKHLVINTLLLQMKIVCFPTDFVNDLCLEGIKH